MSQPAAESESTQTVITSQPAASPPPTPNRKVSIANDPVSESHYDNLGFEPGSKRKTSQVNTSCAERNLHIRNCFTNSCALLSFSYR